MSAFKIAKPLPQFAHGSYVRITKKGRNFNKPGAILQVLEDSGTDLILTIPGHGGVLYADHDQVEPCAPSRKYQRPKVIRVPAPPASDPFEPELED